jgi:hypothetical protein
MPETRWWRVLNVSPGERPPDLGPVIVGRVVIQECHRREVQAVLARLEINERAYRQEAGDALARLDGARDEGLATLAEEEDDG